MAKETIQEAYTEGVLKLEELEKLARRSPKNGQLRRDLSSEITELRKQLIYVKQYLLKTEDLQNQADRQWQRTIVAKERAVTIQKNLFDYYNLKLNFGNTPDVEKLKQDIISNLKFIKGENAEISEENFQELAMGAILEAENAKARHTEIVEELNKLKTDTLENPIWVDESRPEEDRERILSEKRAKLDIETQEPLIEEASVSSPLKTPEEELNDIDDELRRTAEFKKLVAEKEDRYTRIINLKGAKLNSSKFYFKNSDKYIRTLQKEIANRERFIKNYIYDFSQNPNYEVSDELRALIGSKDGADKNTVMQRPTVKQHLDPILKIEEELKNGVSPEREKELKAEKEKREKRLGKKWLLKLKIDKVNSRIQELTQLLSGDLSPEDKEKYQKELLSLKGELIDLQNEYAKVLAEIGEHISNAVEKSANERKAKIKSADKDKPKVDPIKPQQDDLKQPQKDDKNSTDDKSKNDTGTAKPQTKINGVGSQRATSDIPTGAGGNISNVSNTPSNLPMVKEETWLDKLKAKFAKKEEPIKEKVEPETLYSVAVGDDISAKQVEMREAGKYPMVNGQYFYHTIKDGDELKYVREPLENISCTRKELVNKIKEVQEKYGAYYKGLYDEQKKNPLFVNPNIVANKLIGFSNGLEKRQRILKAMCSLDASIHPNEAIDALNGKDTMLFRPGINGKGEFVDIRTDSYLDEGDILAQYAGKVRYKANEQNRENEKNAKAFIERITEFEQSLAENAEDINLEENVKNNNFDNIDIRTEIDNIVSIEAVKGKIAEYKKKGISITQETYKQIVLELLVDESKKRAEARENEEKADEIRAGLGAKTQEANIEEVDNSRNSSARRRGRVEPIDYASSKTRNRRNREGKPRASNVVSIYDDKNAPPVPRFERHRKNKTGDVREK